jgi:hypothetical protein
LPRHYQCTTNIGGGVFGRVYRNSNLFEAHTDAEKKSAYDKLLPVLAKCATKWSKKTEDGGDEDDGAATKQVVERIR